MSMEFPRKDRAKNLGSYERWAVGLGGAALLRAGLRRRPWTVSGLLMSLGGAMLGYRGASGYCPVYRRLGIDTTREALQRGITEERSITVNRSPEEVYRFWRRLENLPLFMKYIRSLSVIDDERSHWVAEGPGALEWDAEIVADEPGERISWRSLPGGDVHTEGTVMFEPAPGNRGTEVRLRMQVLPPGGRMSMVLAPFLRRLTRVQIGQDLHRLKQLMETGEVVTNEPRPEREPGEEGHRGEAQAGGEGSPQQTEEEPYSTPGESFSPPDPGAAQSREVHP